MNADAILATLKEKGWDPNAKDQKAYVSYMLSFHKEMFERVAEKGRGFYRMRKTTESAPAKKVGNHKDDAVLAEMGIRTNSVAENPFEG